MADVESQTAPLLPSDVKMRDVNSPAVQASETTKWRKYAWGLAVVVGGVWLAYVASQSYCKNSADRNLNKGNKLQDPDFPSPTFAKGPTPTGIEAFLAATGLPPNLQDHFPLVPSDNTTFDMFKYFGNLSPQFSVDSAVFGLPGATSKIPDNCELKSVSLLHRHGARYPTTGDATARFAVKLESAKKSRNFKASGPLAFLKDWHDPLGAEILTPYGRLQLFKLGVNFRLQYGALLKKATNKLVFRTTTQDRMTNSALNMAAGFWGLPYEDKYHQLYMVEALDFNNTLCGDLNCPNAGNMQGYGKAREWINLAFNETAARIQRDVAGLDISNADIYAMMSLCSYESVSLGYSEFCNLFTQQDFENYNYAFDLVFYATSFGDPLGSAIGIGYVEELVSRLTGEPITVSHSNVNSTITGNPRLFPLDQPIYVDATHDTTISAVLAAMNFTNLVSSGPLPGDRIPEDRSFVTSNIVPFAAHLVTQVLDCPRMVEPRQIRFLLNDGVLPTSHLENCGENKDGLCPLPAFVAAMQQRIQEVDFTRLCFE